MHTPGVEMPGGPLGQGFPAAQGMAMALKLNGSPAKVYAVLGDGDHVDAVLPVEQPGKPFAHDYVVIGEQDADRCVHRRPSSSWIFGFGMAALMIHRPEREMKDNRPLSDSIRDFRFIRP